MTNILSKYAKKTLTLGFTFLFTIGAVANESQPLLHAETTTLTQNSQAIETKQVITTNLADLWQDKKGEQEISPIYVTVGIPVVWYVEVPTDVTPKGCKYTIKIPGLGWGTDSYNKEEGHLQFVNGSNLIQKTDVADKTDILFTPAETGDILFTCWMGSECHKNYIRVVSDATQIPKTPSNRAIVNASTSTSGAIVATNVPTSGAITVTTVPTSSAVTATVTPTSSAIEATPVPTSTATQTPTSGAIVATSAPNLQSTSVKLKAGATKQIIVNNAGSETVTYRSLQPKVVSVSKKGVVTALKKGNGNIEISVGSITLTYKVTVTTNPSLSKNSITLKKGKTVQISVKGKAAAGTVTYKKSKFVHISQTKKGTILKIKALKKGSEKVKINVNGVTLSLKITVK